jgi:hypothetical protein
MALARVEMIRSNIGGSGKRQRKDSSGRSSFSSSAGERPSGTEAYNEGGTAGDVFRL